MGCCCLTKWTGHHCSVCHQAFADLGMFDKHQDVDYGRSPRIICANPQSLGLVQASNGTWTTPEGALSISRASELGRSRRKSADASPGD